MTIATELSEILALRLSPAYQAAERIRQEIGAEQMATYPPASAQYAGLRLMVGTWETIAMRVRANDDLKVPFYQNNPVNFMWMRLLPGISIVRGSFKIRSRALYAANFEKLNRGYMTWLKKQAPIYRSAALDGISAQFG
jgi:hypothetical protein